MTNPNKRNIKNAKKKDHSEKSHSYHNQQDPAPFRSGQSSQDPHQHKCTPYTNTTKNGKLTQIPTENQPNPPHSYPKHTVAQHIPQDNHNATDNTPPETQADDTDEHNHTIRHHTRPPQPWRISLRKPVQTTQKQPMTEGETGEHSTFAPTTHIQRTPQCAQHTHLCVTRLKTRHHHTNHKANTPLAQFWVPPSHLSHAALNIFVKDRRRLQTKTCVQKGFFEKLKYIQKYILKMVINHVKTTNQLFRRIDIGSLKYVKMVINSGFKLIQLSSIIRVIQNCGQNLFVIRNRTELQFFHAHDANINIFVARHRTEFEFPTHLCPPKPITKCVHKNNFSTIQNNPTNATGQKWAPILAKKPSLISNVISLTPSKD
jgi:hypothetical protein